MVTCPLQTVPMWGEKMVRRESRKARLIRGYETADQVNPEGAPSWSYSDEERLTMTLLTNTLEPTFYSPPEKLAMEALEIHQKVLDTDPEFYQKALVYARNEGHMRLQSVLGLVLLTTKGIDISPKVFNAILRTPNDVASFIDLCRSADIRKGMGQRIKTLLQQWLANKISEYWAVKYRQPLVQAIKLSHPKMTAEWDRVASQIQKERIRQRVTTTGETEDESETVVEPVGTAKEIADYLMKKDRGDEISMDLLDNLPQIKAWEDLNRKVYMEDEVTVGEVRRAIHEGRLPHESITGMISPSVEIWKELMEKMPYFATLRHLATLHRAGVFEDREALLMVCDRISNPALVERSKVLPYRYYVAYKKMQENRAPQAVIEALELALEASFNNITEMDGRGCIGIDVSGSMSSTPMNVKGGAKGLAYNEIAGTFGIPLMFKSRDVITLPFDYEGGGWGSPTRSGVYPDILDRSRPMLWNINQICSHSGGATDVSLPIRYLENNDVTVDWFIGITDNIEWGQSGGSSEGWLTAWRRYKANFNPTCKAFLVTIAPYGHSMYPFGEPDVHQIFGWSDQVLRFIQLGIAGLDSQVDYIRNLDLQVEVIERDAPVHE